MDPRHLLGDVPLYPRSQYVRELRGELPPDAFSPARSRLALVPLYLAFIGLATVAIAASWVPWVVVPLLSLIIGVGFACLTFVAHEALHGGIVRGRVLQQLVGWIGFLPFAVSPRLWIAWHNRAHHGGTNLDDDPDGYPMLDRYLAHRSIRFSVDAFSLGGRRWRGALSLLLGFTVQSAHQLISAADRGFLSRGQRRIALLETGLAVAVWVAVAALIGLVPFVFAFVLPLLVANACIMAFILTNHSLSPRVPINDPLVSSLSVTTTRVVDWLTLRFGLHVEHHLFPAMSSRHAPAVRALILARWPERYQSLPLVAALRRMHQTARVYKDATTLIDPTTGREFSTLLPRTDAALAR
jgi:fatty acid desaturase